MRQNRQCLVKLWKCRKAMSILPHEAKALLQLFCLEPIIFGWRQNSFSGAFASWGKIKIDYFTWTDQDWIGLMIFKNFADKGWFGFNFMESDLDSDWKISQSAHLCHMYDWVQDVCTTVKMAKWKVTIPAVPGVRCSDLTLVLLVLIVQVTVIAWLESMARL